MDDRIVDKMNFYLAKLHSIKVYNNKIDEMEYTNLVNLISVIKTELVNKNVVEKDIVVWLENNERNILHILNKYKHTITTPHHFY